MGYFDFLIDKNNGQPKQGLEYIYRFDMVWKPGELEGYPIKPGTVVTDVIQLENKSYEFTNKETGERFRTNYAWALAENTPENVKRIEDYNKEWVKFKEYEKKVEALRKNIITLDGR